jgi:hypothetical protein
MHTKKFSRVSKTKQNFRSTTISRKRGGGKSILQILTSLFQQLFSLPRKAAQKLATLFRRGATAQDAFAEAEIPATKTQEELFDNLRDQTLEIITNNSDNISSQMVSHRDDGNNGIVFFPSFVSRLWKKSEKLKIDPKAKHIEDEENYLSKKNGWAGDDYKTDKNFLWSQNYIFNHGIKEELLFHVYYGIYFSVDFDYKNKEFVISYELYQNFHLKYIKETFLVEEELHKFLNEMNLIINKISFNFFNIENIIKETKIKIETHKKTLTKLTLAIFQILVKRMELVFDFLKIFRDCLKNNKNELESDALDNSKEKFALDINSTVNKDKNSTVNYDPELIYYYSHLYPKDFFNDEKKKQDFKKMDLLIYTIMFLLNFTNKTPFKLIEMHLNNLKQKKILPKSEVAKLENLIYQTSNQIKEIALTDNSLYDKYSVIHSSLYGT